MAFIKSLSYIHAKVYTCTIESMHTTTHATSSLDSYKKACSGRINWHTVWPHSNCKINAYSTTDVHVCVMITNMVTYTIVYLAEDTHEAIGHTYTCVHMNNAKK